MSEYYAVVRSSDHLAHYGVKGMTWGVRKYINKQGGLTKAGEKRYGDFSVKKSSPKKMQHDYNRLDSSRANVNAEVIDAKRNLNKKNSELSAFVAASKKKKVKIDPELAKAIKRITKNINQRNSQLNGIEDLQSRIIKQANKNNYSVKEKKVIRNGVSKLDRENKVKNSDFEKQIVGTKVKIKKKRSG